MAKPKVHQTMAIWTTGMYGTPKMASDYKNTQHRSEAFGEGRYLNETSAHGLDCISEHNAINCLFCRSVRPVFYFHQHHPLRDV